jgi:arylsulfatase A-like enzyme
MKHRLHFPILALALAGLAIHSLAADAKKPNILLIVADDLGYGELTAQGFTKDIPTPNVDSIAQNGVRFTSGYVSGPYCSPTRAGLLTGRYQQRFGHEFNPGPAQSPGEKIGLSLDEKTLGDRLKPAGYANAWIGKSHLGSDPEFHPLRRGFDHYLGFLGGQHSYLDVDGQGGKGKDPLQRDGVPLDKIDYTTDAFGREAISFIEEHKDQPWFVYLAFNAVHEPLHSIDKYLSRFPNITDPKRKEFAAGLSALDDNVGAVLAKLRELKLEEDTLIFFISDNGGPTKQTTSNNGPLRGFKAQTWEGGIRIAWIVQWKGHIPAGKVDDRPVIQLDILPTALAAAQVPVQPEWKLDGVNLLPFVSGEKTEPPHDALYWRFGQQIAIRKGDWKLVKAPGGSLQPGGGRGGQLIGVADTEGAELYNVTEDIGEKTNLAEKNPEKLKELAADWNRWNRFNVQPKWVPGNKAAPAPVVVAKAVEAAPAVPPAPAAAVPSPAPAPSAAPVATASATGPWKYGDTLPKDQSPQIAGHGLAIAAQIEATGPEGVIVAQGGGGNGFALYLHEGKLAFAIRAKKQLSAVTSEKPLPPGAHKVEAKFTSDLEVALFVDGQPFGEGKADAFIANQPVEGLTVGNDGKGAVGDYTAPNDFAGKIENVTVQAL